LFVTDLFNEVDEQIRSERAKSLAIRLAPWALALLVAVLAGIAGFYGWRDYQGKQQAAASEKYAAAFDLLQAGDSAKAFDAFGAVAKSAPAGYKSLALMQQAGLRMAAGKNQEAVALYDAAAKAAPGPMIEDAAALKATLALMDTAPFKDVEARLKPLVVEGRPYRPEALEAMAFARLAAGDLKAARSDFSVIALMPGASDTARARAAAARTLIDSGSAKQLPAVVKAAAAAPAQASPTVSAAGQAPAPQPSTSGTP
jgi:hypothetical protein